MTSASLLPDADDLPDGFPTVEAVVPVRLFQFRLRGVVPPPLAGRGGARKGPRDTTGRFIGGVPLSARSGPSNLSERASQRPLAKHAAGACRASAPHSFTFVEARHEHVGHA